MLDRRIRPGVTLVFSLLISMPLVGQQRMAIAAGAIEVGANEVGSVATYCLDYSRATPTSNDTYAHVLTANESATVRFDDGSSMSLQAAIETNRVKLQGSHISLAEYLKVANDAVVTQRTPIPADVREAIQAMSTEYEHASPSERKDLEAAFEEATPNLWDHTHLSFKNLTNHALHVSFDDTTVLSPQQESLQGSAFSHLSHANSSSNRRTTQQDLWQLGDAQQQSALAYLGYYQGSIDGLTGKGTKTAIASFQTAEHLPVTAEFDAQTTEALHRQVNQKRDAAINRQQKGFSLVTITNTPNQPNGRYTVVSGSESESFSTSNPMELSTRLNNMLRNSGGKTLYLDLDSFTDDKARALTGTLRRQQQQFDDSVLIDGVPRSEDDPDIQAVLFANDTKIISTDVKVEEVTQGPKRGLFRATIDFLVSVGNGLRRVSVSFYSKTLAYSQELASLLMSHAGSQGSPAMSGSSIAQLVSLTEHDFRSRHPEITDEAYQKEIRTQLGTVEISELFWLKAVVSDDGIGL